MTQNKPDHPRILFLFSDTGGGHRSATEAIIEAIDLEFGDLIDTEMVDILKDYAPRPLNHMPEWYPKMVRVPQAWGLGYKLSNGKRRARLITDSAWIYVRRSIERLIEQHPSDLVVSVHPLANSHPLKALGKYRPPFVTVVTDLVTTHALWYHRQVDKCIVPTQAARRRAVRFGLKDEQVKVIGLPVADRFCQPPGDRFELRRNLGWPQDKPIILLVGGGEGMGPLEKIARSLAASRPKGTLVVITGRNRRLKSRLESYNWPMQTFIYGFVREMPAFMSAADMIVTKAGPGTISEALNAGLPIILYSYLPGQEEGNISFVVSKGAGVWAPHPDEVVLVLNEWIADPKKRKLAAENARRLANPMAARQIARELASYLEIQIDSEFPESVSQRAI